MAFSRTHPLASYLLRHLASCCCRPRSDAVVVDVLMMSCTVVAVVMVRCKSSHLCSIHVDACALTCVWCRRLPVAVSSRVAFAHPGVLVYDIVKARVVDLFVLSVMGLCALLILYALLRSSCPQRSIRCPPAAPLRSKFSCVLLACCSTTPRSLAAVYTFLCPSLVELAQRVVLSSSFLCCLLW